MRNQKNYICNQCGTVHRRWQGQCSGCHAWNTIEEQLDTSTQPVGVKRNKKNHIPLPSLESLQGNDDAYKRLSTSNNELDRVLGGGIVPGSAILIGGDPGIGKSTLLLQAAASMSRQHKCYYISGEEATEQIRMRARRLGVDDAPLELASVSEVEMIAALIQQEKPALIIADSIQTLYLSDLDAAPGSVTQVRAAAHILIRAAKQHNTTLILVGHVTKDGAIAGPRLLEHMVDTVLYFEGERAHAYRLLRGVKNRFGATDEIGVFDMTEQGLAEVQNPSSMFLQDHESHGAGSVVYAGMEGTRPILIEVQALVAPSYLATPRRNVVGWDNNRLSMVLAVLETRLGLKFGQKDIYCNMAGGIRVMEPAADLAVAAALISSLKDEVIPANIAFAGEIGLSGEIRPVPRMELRLKEAQKLGFNALCGGYKKQQRANAMQHHVENIHNVMHYMKG